MRVLSLVIIMLAISMSGMAQSIGGIVERNKNGVISSVKYSREGKNVAVPENAAMFFEAQTGQALLRPERLTQLRE